jgi:hypothetical protein
LFAVGHFAYKYGMSKFGFKPLLILAAAVPAVIGFKASAQSAAPVQGNESGGGGQFATPATSAGEEPWFKSFRDSVKALRIFDAGLTTSSLRVQQSLQAAEAFVIVTQLIAAFEKHGVSPAKVARIKEYLPKIRFESVIETLSVERGGKDILVDARTTKRQTEYQTELQFQKNEAEAGLLRRQELYLHEACLAAGLENSLEYRTSRALLAELHAKQRGQVTTNDAARAAIIERVGQGEDFQDLLAPEQRAAELRIRQELAKPSTSKAWDEPVGAFGESPFSEESVRVLAHLQFEMRAIPKELVKESVGELTTNVKEEFEALRLSDLTTERYLQFRPKIARILHDQATAEIISLTDRTGSSEKTTHRLALTLALDRAIETWSRSNGAENDGAESWLDQYAAAAPTVLQELIGAMKKEGSYDSFVAEVDTQAASLSSAIHAELESLSQRAVAASLAVP